MSTTHGSTAHATTHAVAAHTTVPSATATAVSWCCVYNLRTVDIRVCVLVAARWSGGSAAHGVLVGIGEAGVLVIALRDKGRSDGECVLDFSYVYWPSIGGLVSRGAVVMKIVVTLSRSRICRMKYNL